MCLHVAKVVPVLQRLFSVSRRSMALSSLVASMVLMGWTTSVQATEGDGVEPTVKVSRSAKSVRAGRVKSAAVRRHAEAPARPSFGSTYGLHGMRDALDLKSSVALVVDQDTSEVLFSKNSQAVLPIASLTKLMTALVVVEANQAMDEPVLVTEEDIDTEKGSRSRLSVGTQLTRGEMLHLALMSSENRAAHALGRHYPGGLTAFVAAMNRKAQALGMADTHYVEPTGLSSHNQSSAPDLARLVAAAYQFPLLRELSTSPAYRVAVGRRTLQFHNTNGLVSNPSWDIGLQKTGYIVEAGRCLVMQASLAGRKLIMVFLDSTGKYSRIGDAERVRRWIEHGGSPRRAPAAVAPPLVTAVVS
jgi:D-alanyl-D-alanine endopeptidase (penicillin-binding protein 7)